MEMFLDYARAVIEILGIVGVAIEVTPIKVSPLKWIGKRLNSNVIERIEKLERKSLERDLKETRSIILDFANSIRNGRKHTAEEYNHLLELIDEYHDLCEKNSIKNGVIDVQSRYIVDTYMRLSKKGEFKEKIKSGDLL